jgi:2-amino-4-hydroxy-6-hydroxymethyldihydropteridine diphosphokinase
VGYAEQGDFLNMVCHVFTTLSPLDLLSALQKIETELGRKRLIRWGPRTLDLDLLLYDEIKLCSETLTVPHPRMFERAFVMIPLRDVYHCEYINGRLFDDLIENCDDNSGIKLFKIIK